MSANDRQVGGSHYKGKIQHWDWAASEGLDYFQGAITKYIARWRKKGGIQDLLKAKHYLEKYIELEEKKLPTQMAHNGVTLEEVERIRNMHNITNTDLLGIHLPADPSY